MEHENCPSQRPVDNKLATSALLSFEANSEAKTLQQATSTQESRISGADDPSAISVRFATVAFLQQSRSRVNPLLTS
eukprot:6489123-Amphidinium_carterae.2